MEYHISPFCSIWNEGIFNLPLSLVDKYIKIASEYQLKALLLVFRNGGKYSSAQIARQLGIPTADVEEIMAFWCEEGLVSSGDTPACQKPPESQSAAKPQTINVTEKKELLAPPTLTPQDITVLCGENEMLSFLLNEAQNVLGRTISHAEQEMLINMVNYYGLTAEVVLMILEYYRSEKEKGRAIGIAYINKMAKNWSEEGIATISDAEEKLKILSVSDGRWDEIVGLTGIRHRTPTVKQREMIAGWFQDFSIEMIALACDIMKENTDSPNLPYVNSVLKRWKKNGVSSPAQVQAEQTAFAKKKSAKKDGKISGKPSFDLEKIKQNARNNTDIKF